jgi:hypothetical protein
VLLIKRMTSLRRDLVAVSDLMRDSVSRLQDTTPAAALSASSRVSLNDSDCGGVCSGAKAAGSGIMVPTSRFSSLEPTASAASYYTAVGTDDGPGSKSGLCSPAASQKELQHQKLTRAAAIAGQTDNHAAPGGPEPSASQEQQQQPQVEPALQLTDIELQGLKAGKKPGGLSTQVADALKQPVPVGAYVVRDIKISRLAGELEPILM